MRGLALGGVFLGLASLAQAGELPSQPPVKLVLSVQQAMLIVETLGQIGCQTVAALANCDLARQTIKDIQAQAREQVK